MRAAPPPNVKGEPLEESVRALYRYECTKPGEVRWVEVRELSTDDWESVMAAHRDIYRFTRGLDGFLSFAWGDLRNVRDELLRQLQEHGEPDAWMMPLIEYRILNYSTALKLYHEHTTAQVNRTGDDALKARVAAEFSEVYDRCFAYRIIYAMRNAFQHGVRGLLSVKMSVRLADGPETGRESQIHAHLAKDVFVAGLGNAAVRGQVREMDDEIDLLKLSEESFAEVQLLQVRLDSLLHPGAPAAAQLLIQYIQELRGERPHFHKYIRGFPTNVLVAKTLDRGGFEYVAQQAGRRATYAGEPPGDALAALPVYPPSGHMR